LIKLELLKKKTQNMMKTGLITVLIATGMAVSCNKNNNNTVQPPTPIPPGMVQTLGQSNFQFGIDLFTEVVKNRPDENILISPWSVQTALLMARNGAAGNTGVQLDQGMHLTGHAIDTINREYQLLRLLMEQQSGHPRVRNANVFFYDAHRMRPEEAFMQKIQTWYGAPSIIEQFNDPGAVQRINDWVKQNTQQKIQGIIDEIGPLDLAFLINAIHFKSDWERAMPTEMVSNQSFTGFGNRARTVPFVGDDGEYAAVTHQGLKMVDVPFKDRNFTLSFIIPEQSTTSGAWATQLTPTVIRALYSNLATGRIMFAFPKLDLEFEGGLIPDLQGLGVTDAFSPGLANFSDLGEPLIGPTLFIKTVAHKAVLKVDEKGAEGAAVTSLGFATTSMPPLYRFDKPFVILLRHQPTNTLLFAGLVGEF
jgi:serine protease inhibitor